MSLLASCDAMRNEFTTVLRGLDSAASLNKALFLHQFEIGLSLIRFDVALTAEERRFVVNSFDSVLCAELHALRHLSSMDPVFEESRLWVALLRERAAVLVTATTEADVAAVFLLNDAKLEAEIPLDSLSSVTATTTMLDGLPKLPLLSVESSETIARLLGALPVGGVASRQGLVEWVVRRAQERQQEVFHSSSALMDFPSALSGVLNELLTDIDALRSSIQSFRSQIENEIVILTFRVVSAIVDLLLPASERSGRQSQLFYRKWLCDLYRMLVDERLLSPFMKLLDQPLATSDSAVADDAVAPGALFGKKMPPMDGAHSLLCPREVHPSSAHFNSRVLFTLLNGSNVLVDGTLLTKRTAMRHHHRFRYPEVQQSDDVGKMFEALVEDTRLVLSPHDPLRAAIVLNYCDFLVQVQRAPAIARELVTSYLDEVATEPIQPLTTKQIDFSSAAGVGGGGSGAAASVPSASFSVTNVRRTGLTSAASSSAAAAAPSAVSSAPKEVSGGGLTIPDKVPSWLEKDERAQFFTLLALLKAASETLTPLST